jgi:hypothetical protein
VIHGDLVIVDIKWRVLGGLLAVLDLRQHVYSPKLVNEYRSNLVLKAVEVI